jgi:alpha-galactosidase
MAPRIALIGAGSAMFGLGAVGDVLKSKPLEGSTIVLNDINPESLDFVTDTARTYVKQQGLNFTIESTTSLDKALKGCNFCVISIEVGDRHQLWEQDWNIPMSYGFKQVYGENGGPGGLFHALRITPHILDICGRISEICPEAHVINLSNPMVRIMHAITTKYPKLKCTGICHEVVSLIEHLPIMLNTPIDNLELKAGGFNHFSVLVVAKYKDTGKDAYPDIRAKAPEYFASAPAVFGYIGERKLFQEVLKRFGVLPITTDSHFGEYIPWAQSAVDHRGIMEFYTSYKSEMSSNRDDAMDRVAQGTPVEEYWRVVNIIEGIIDDDGHYEMAVNIPNDGFIEALPRDQCVEVPATIDRHGVHGVRLEPYPKAFGNLLKLQVAVNEMTTEAILTKSKDVALQALLVDPVVDNAAAAAELLDTMISLQSKWLGYLS